jgi:two-component system, cell cycle sensor histidine kinase and response regulator CckA
MNILIADDRADNLYFLESLFRGNGYETLSVSNGAEALEKLKSGNFDVIISDILMPVMDGFELCRKVRADKALADIPFIFYTATYTGPQDEEFAIKIGADRFIIKPCEPDILLSAVRELITYKQKNKETMREHLPEEEVLKLYNERLVRKLEQKMLQLEDEIKIRQRIEENLRERERRLTSIYDSVENAIFHLSVESIGTYRFITVNHTFYTMTGLNEEMVLGKRVNDVIPEPSLSIVLEKYKLAIEKKSSIQWEETSDYPSGRITGEITVSPIFNEKGQCNFLVGSIHDITERKQAEISLQKTRLQLQLFIKYAPAAIAMFDNGMKYIAASNRFLEDYKLGNIDIIGKSHYELFPEIPDSIKEVHRRCLAGATERCEEESFQRADGRTDWVRWEIRPWFEYSGKIGGIILFSEVITERKEAEQALYESEERIRHAAEAAHFGTYSYYFETGKIYFSPEHLALYGLPADSTIELDNDMTAKALHPEDKEKFISALSKANIPGGDNSGILDIEFRIIRTDGELRCLRAIGRTIFDQAGRPLRADGTVADITRRKQAEKALLESEERYRLLFENSIDGVFLTSPDGAILSVNPAGCRMFGRSEEEIITLGRDGIIDVKDPRFKLGIEVRENIGIVTGELVGIKSGGEKFPLEVSSLVFTDKENRKRTSTIMRDVTERKKAEDKIQKLNRIYALLSEINKTIIRIDNRQDLYETVCRIAVETGKFRFCWIGLIDVENDSIKPAAQCGFSDGYLDNINFPLSGDDWKKYWLPSVVALQEKKYTIFNDIQNDERMLEWFEKALKRGYHSMASFPLLREDAVYGTITFYSSQTGFFDEEEVSLLEELSFDISYCLETLERQKQKQKIEEERDRLFKYSIDMMCIFGFDGYFKQLNPAWEKTLGWTNEELMAKPFLKIVFPEDRASVVEIGKKFTTKVQQIVANDITRILCRDGTYKWLSWDLVPIPEDGRIFAVARDISKVIENEAECKKLESQLVQAQKLESLGTMAGGIAHDFNNILNIIIGYATLLKSVKPEDEELKKSIEIILDAGWRGSKLVKQLLTFARKSETVFQPVQINDIINEIRILLKATFPKTIEFKCNLMEDLPSIIGDSTQIHQIILNLCVNARDAMPNGGTLTISSSHLNSEEVKIKNPEAEAGKYVEMQVTDTGTGMDEVTMQKIFEPFFTTKEKGKGTGLGLSLVYGIVKNHGGYINLVSEPDKGTTFSIYLPSQERSEEIFKEIIVTGDREAVQGTGTVLVIEDEKELAELLTTTLVLKGYKVIAAYDGLQGIMVYQEHKDEIKIVISDLGLPRMNGEEVFKQIKKMNHRVKIILLSGFIDPEVKARLYEAGARHFLEKPYTPDNVFQAIKKAMEDKQNGA